MQLSVIRATSLPPGAAGRDGRGAGGAVARRAGDADDAQHVPLRRRVGEERDARRAAPQGDHQHLEEAEDAVAQRLPAGQGGEGRREGEGRG